MRPAAGFLRPLAVLAGAALFCCLAVLVWLHFATSDELDYLVRVISTAPRTARFTYFDAAGKVFDGETAPVHYRAVTLAEVDPRLNDDLIALEDRNFRTHSGIDYVRSLKAVADFGAAARVPGAKNTAGGSTITQQLIKNLLERRHRVLVWKLREIFLAQRLEKTLALMTAEQSRTLDFTPAKRLILESYWNHLFFSHRHRGLGNLTQLLFGHSPAKLSVPERTAILAAVRAPGMLAASEESAGRLLALVARQLEKTGRIQKGESLLPENFAKETFSRFVALRRQNPGPTKQLTTSYAQSVKTLFHLDFSARDFSLGEFEIRTPRMSDLDTRMRAALEAALGKLNTHSAKPCDVTGAYMLLRLSDAAVISASEDKCSQFNELIQSRRQVSSTIKPMLYAYALETLHLEPSAIFTDKRITVTGRDGKPYAPRNHYRAFRGDMNLRTALQISANTVSLQLYQKISPPEFIRRLKTAYARFPGEDISAQLHPDHSLALGTVDLAPSHVASAYLTLLNTGMKQYPQWGYWTRTAIHPNGGNHFLPGASSAEQVFDPLAADQVKEMLTAVLRPEGTGGQYLAESGKFIVHELGAKSGSGPLDTWFVGYSQDLLLLVWLGFRERGERPRDFHAATLWYDLFAKTLPLFQPQPMRYSAALERRYFCAETGLPASTNCRRTQAALFRAKHR